MKKRNFTKEEELIKSECEKMIAYDKAVYQYIMEHQMDRKYHPSAVVFNALKKMYFEAEGRRDGIREYIIHDLAYETIGELIGYLMRDKNYNYNTIEYLCRAYTQAELEGRKRSMYQYIDAMIYWWREQHGIYDYEYEG